MTRKLSFNRDQILEKSMRVFWLQGYHRTSMRDIITETGLNPGSIYHSFKNKKSLFLEVTDFYYQRLTARVNNQLSSTASCKKIISDFFALVVRGESSLSGRGCLLVNTLLDSSEDREIQPHVAAMFHGFEEMFYWLIVKGQKNKEFKLSLSARDEAQVLVNCYMGLRVQSLAEQTEEHMLRIISNHINRLI